MRMNHPGSPGGYRGGEGGRARRSDPRELAELSVTVWLTPENAAFLRKNGLLWIRMNEKETRITLCREFPFDLPWEYISVLDEENREIGIIRNLQLFEGETAELLRAELERRYYAPIILRVDSVKERYGFSYWKVQTAEGELRFTLHDTYRSILHVNSNRLIFVDVNGNRFEIPDARELDEKSRRKLDLYL